MTVLWFRLFSMLKPEPKTGPGGRCHCGSCRAFETKEECVTRCIFEQLTIGELTVQASLRQLQREGQNKKVRESRTKSYAQRQNRGLYESQVGRTFESLRVPLNTLYMTSAASLSTFPPPSTEDSSTCTLVPAAASYEGRADPS